MYFGLPVVGTRVDGIPFMVTHEETGLLIAPQQATEFAEAAIQLSEQTELRRQLGLNAPSVYT